MSMSLPFELQIALRYLVARRKQAFISTISLVSILGVAVGVMALVIALALMTGLQQELRDRIVGSSAHVYVYKVTGGGITDYQAEVQQLLGVPRVLGAAPAMLGKALVTTGATQAFITIKGIDPVLEATVTEVAQAVRHGSLDALVGDEGASLGGVVLGEDLASSLGKFVGDQVTLVTPQGTLSPMGIIPRQMRLRVVGIFRLGLLEFDTSYGFVSLDVARRLLHRDQVDLIGLRVDDMYAAPDVAKSVTEMLGPGYLTQDWSQQNQALFSALWIEKMAISIAIGLIRDGGRAEHHRLAHPVGHGEEPRHCHSQDDGGRGAEHLGYLHTSGCHHWGGGHGGRCRRRVSRFDDRRSIQIASRPDRRVPGFLRAIYHRDAGFRSGHRGGPGGVLSRDDLPVTAGVPGSIRRRRSGTSRG